MKKEFKVNFPMCDSFYHAPIKTQGNCPLHDYICPVCGLGVGGSPGCGCPEMRQRYFKLWGPSYETGA